MIGIYSGTVNEFLAEKKMVINIGNNLGIWCGKFSIRLGHAYPTIVKDYQDRYIKLRSYLNPLPTLEKGLTWVLDQNHLITIINIVGVEGVMTENHKDKVDFKAIGNALKKLEETHPLREKIIFFSLQNFKDIGASEVEMLRIIKDNIDDKHLNIKLLPVDFLICFKTQNGIVKEEFEEDLELYK